MSLPSFHKNFFFFKKTNNLDVTFSTVEMFY